MSHGRFFWYDLVSKDRKASRAFLTSLFGWTASDAAMPDGTPYTSFSVQKHLVCGLMPLTEARDFNQGQGYWMTYLRVDRLAPSIVRAKQQGGVTLSGALPVPDLGAYQIIRDPAGTLLALVEARQSILSSGMLWTSVIWNELLCRQGEGPVADFYQVVAGWSYQKTPQQAFDYSLFSLGGSQVAGILEMPDTAYAGLRPAWQTYIGVSDVDALTAKALDCGGHITAEPFELPGVGRLALIVEPGGCQITLLQPLQ